MTTTPKPPGRDAPLTICEPCTVTIRGVEYHGVIVGFQSLDALYLETRSWSAADWFDPKPTQSATIDLYPHGVKPTRKP